MSALTALLLSMSAWGAEVEVVVVEGALHPGAVGTLDVAVLDDAGRPLEEAPRLRVGSDPTWVSEASVVSPGVYRFFVHAPDQRGAVPVEVTWPGGQATRTVPMARLSEQALSVRTAVDAGVGAVRFRVVGTDLPPPAQLQVVTSEGRVASVVARGDQLDVTLEPESQPYARWIVVGVRDARRAGLPTWHVLPVRARADVPVDTEPGATVRVEVGQRTYGPVVTDAEGRATLSLTHGPDESTGRMWVVDAAGNEASRTFPLTGPTSPILMAFVDRPRRPGEVPPDVVIHAVRPDGAPWSRQPPTCRSSALGVLPVTSVGPGTWRVGLPGTLPRGAWGLRVQCDLDNDVQRTLQVAIDEGTPQRLWGRMWPEVLSSDYPVGTLQVALENVFGQRVDPAGRFTAEAVLGRVVLEEPLGPFVSGTYRGDAALAAGEDRVLLRWFAPAGTEDPDLIEVVTGPQRGDAQLVYVRVLDRRRRPLADKVVEVTSGGRVEQGTTGSDGWATLSWSARASLMPVRVQVERREVWGLVVPGAPSPRGPGRPDLTTELPVTLDPGLVADVQLTVTPSSLTAGPRATATIHAAPLDRDGKLAAEVPPTVEVSEGRLGDPERAPDGSWTWTYVAPPGFRDRDVEVVARDETLGVSSERTLRIRSASVERWVSLSAGVQSNFGRITSPTFAFDAAWRIRLGPRDSTLPPGRARLMVRAGLGWFGAGATTGVDTTVEDELRMDLIPIHVALGLRQEYPAHAYWFTLGGVVAPYVGSAAYGGVVVTRRVGVLPPGLVATAGYGVRVPGGEVAFELKGTVLTSPGNDISFEGQVGGLAATVAYRLVY